MGKSTTIWIDGDSCPKPVKDIVFKTGERLKINIVLVANSYQNIPYSDYLRLTVVSNGFDAADQHIVERVEMHDIVITADIPLASEVLKKKARVLNPRGEIYTTNTIGSILSLRNTMKEFRDAGIITGGPAVFGPKDVKNFADSLNKLLA